MPQGHQDMPGDALVWRQLSAFALDLNPERPAAGCGNDEIACSNLICRRLIHSAMDVIPPLELQRGLNLVMDGPLWAVLDRCRGFGRLRLVSGLTSRQPR